MDWDKILDNRKHVLANYHDVPDYLLLPEVTTLLHHFKDNTKHLFFNTLWNTGVRLLEALSLTPESFILDKGDPFYIEVKTLKAEMRICNKNKNKYKKTPPLG